MHEGRAQVLQAELDRFVDIVSREMNPERIVLFGSFTHGEVHEWSDLDLVVVMETDLPKPSKNNTPASPSTGDNRPVCLHTGRVGAPQGRESVYP